MENKELFAQTISDLEEVRDVISERHKDNPTLTLRFGSVFNQLINSLGVHIGSVVSPTAVPSGFKPEPLKKVFGKTISENKTPVLKPIEVDEVEAFKEKINTIYQTFLERENKDLKEALEEIEIRGVAKLAGVENYDTQKVDGNFLNKIKRAIEAKTKLAADQEDAKEKLNSEPGDEGDSENEDKLNEDDSADQEDAKEK